MKKRTRTEVLHGFRYATEHENTGAWLSGIKPVLARYFSPPSFLAFCRRYPTNKMPRSMPNGLAWSALVATAALFLVYPIFPSKDAYILCSFPGNRSMYTVDMHNTLSECILVRSSRILATGSLGTSRHLSMVIRTLFPITTWSRQSTGTVAFRLVG
jgi:hypothetical protein